MKKKTRTKPDPLKQIAKYIESKGWKVVVIGPAQIQQQTGSFKYNYEFVVKFTGAKKESAAPRASSEESK